MRTMETNPILRDEKKFLDLEEFYGDFGKKTEAPSCFYNYAADRPAEFSGFIDAPSSNFLKSLGLNA